MNDQEIAQCGVNLCGSWERGGNRGRTPRLEPKHIADAQVRPRKTTASRTRLDCVTIPSPPHLTRPDGSPVRVLVVDDEPNLAELLTSALRLEGMDVSAALDGTSAIRMMRQNVPDIVVLDVMLPDMNGIAVLRRLREQEARVPVLFLTARDAVEDRVVGLTAGGDDYVTKPFSLEEVVARLRGLLRRRGALTREEHGILTVGDLRLDEDAHEVWRAGDEIRLTATEFELLRFLMRNPRRVLSKTQILDRVWNYDFGGKANIVELYVSYLRRKIDRGREPMIHTLRGVGYLLKPVKDAGAPRA
jgi:two-component system OmpR family response regulator